MNRRPPFASLFGLLAISTAAALADTPILPGQGFPASRYETLWTKSPFAVATPEAVQGSPDYQLVGIARFDGVSYASLIETQTQQHFLLSSENPSRGLTLISITRGVGSSGNQAVVQKDGQPITLRQDASNPGPVALNNGVFPLSAPAPQSLPMPGAGGGGFAPSMPPPLHKRLSLIRLPPNPVQSAPPPAPTTP